MHIKQTHKSDTQPNLLKEHVSQTHGLTKIENNETPTRNIRKPGDVGNLNLCSFNENCNGFIGLKPAIALFAYTFRWAAYKKSHRTVKHIWFLPTQKPTLKCEAFTNTDKK